MLSVRFWGVRGSLPCPGPDTVIYGGNTSCLEIRADERLIIIDLGTGVRPLGEWLLANDYKKSGKIKADIFLTHTHWDHILGFPMFNPIYIPGTELSITSPVSIENESLKSIIESQFSHKYWPVRADELAASINYNQIKEETLDLGGGLTVKTKFLNHPIYCLGYRINYQGKSIATVYDHEPYRNLCAGNETQGDADAAQKNEKIRQFVKGADVVIHDAQYTSEDYPCHIGWGHCSCDHAVQTCKDADVKKLVLFHHEPARTDSQLEQIEKKYVKFTSPEIVMAKEGMIIQV